jgi:hypothetical protein
MIYFPHIPKAGGQTLIHGFYKAYGIDCCIKIWDPQFGADVDAVHFEYLKPKDFENKFAIIGHLKIKQFLKNNYMKKEFEKGHVKIITSVRDPIDRLISMYNYIYYNSRHPKHDEIQNIKYEDFVLSQPRNGQYSFLEMEPSLDIDSLFETVVIFPIENSIKGFTKVLNNYSGVDIGKLEVKNRSLKWANGNRLFRKEDLGSEALKELSRKHHIDFKIYYKSIGGFKNSDSALRWKAQH